MFKRIALIALCLTLAACGRAPMPTRCAPTSSAA